MTHQDAVTPVTPVTGVDTPVDTPVGRRRADHSRTLSELLERRPDLAGVHALADLSDEALRWSA